MGVMFRLSRRGAVASEREEVAMRGRPSARAGRRGGLGLEVQGRFGVTLSRPEEHCRVSGLTVTSEWTQVPVGDALQQ